MAISLAPMPFARELDGDIGFARVPGHRLQHDAPSGVRHDFKSDLGREQGSPLASPKALAASPASWALCLPPSFFMIRPSAAVSDLRLYLAAHRPSGLAATDQKLFACTDSHATKGRFLTRNDSVGWKSVAPQFPKRGVSRERIEVKIRKRRTTKSLLVPVRKDKDQANATIPNESFRLSSRRPRLQLVSIRLIV